MAGKVFFSVTMSLDGFIAPESMEDLMGPRWMELQQWVFPQRFFRENLKLGDSGEEGRENDIVRETFERTGASVMGKRMFKAGEQAWPEDAPFHTPVFVVTHEERDPWERPGGTTFHFVNDGVEARARPSPRGRRRPGRPHRGRRRNDSRVRERRPDRRVHDRARTRAVRLRNPPVRGRGRGPRGPGAGPRGADTAGDPPDLRSPGAVTGSGIARAPVVVGAIGSHGRGALSANPTNQRPADGTSSREIGEGRAERRCAPAVLLFWRQEPRAYGEALWSTAIASIETSRPRGSRTCAGADRAGGGSGMWRA